MISTDKIFREINCSVSRRIRLNIKVYFLKLNNDKLTPLSLPKMRNKITWEKEYLDQI